MTRPPQALLVVDDNPNNLKVVIGHLEAYDFEIYTARDGASGLRRARLARPDLILLDVQMPGIDGYETCRRLKADPETSHIPVVFMTALTETADKIRGFRAGAVDYVTKPIQLDELMARVETHLELARLQRQLQAQNALLEDRVDERTRALSETNGALSRFVPDAFLASLGHADITGVRLGEHVRGEYTVMFSDIRSYTTLSEALGPAETFALLSAYCARMGPIITAHGGTVCQYLGDGLLAIFPSPDDAARAAIVQQHAIDAFNDERARGGAAPIRVGIGLNTGDLTLGILGDGRRLDAAIVGDAVNLAARMEGLTKHYGVRVAASGSVIDGLARPEALTTRFLDRVLAKGKTEPTAVYEIVDADPPALQSKKRAAQPTFAAGQRALTEGAFADAVQAFTEVIRALPQDRTARHYLERAASALLRGAAPEGLPEPPK